MFRRIINMSDKISVLSDNELDVVGAGTFLPPLIDVSTNISKSRVTQTNNSTVKFSWSVDPVQQANSVGTTVSIRLG